MKIDRWIGENGKRFTAAILDDSQLRLTDAQRREVESLDVELDRKHRERFTLIDGSGR